jgi:hypothetical protein
MFLALWRFITDSWSSPSRARLLYVVFTIGFVVMAIAGAIRGDALVLTLGAVFGLLTLAIATLAPRLSPLLGAPKRDREADA